MLRKVLFAAAAALALSAGRRVGAASAATLRFAFQGDLKSLDPYTLNETFTHRACSATSMRG